MKLSKSQFLYTFALFHPFPFYKHKLAAAVPVSHPYLEISCFFGDWENLSQMPPTDLPLCHISGLSHKFMPKIIIDKGKNYNILYDICLLASSVPPPSLYAGIYQLLVKHIHKEEGKYLKNQSSIRKKNGRIKYWHTIKDVCCS